MIAIRPLAPLLAALALVAAGCGSAPVAAPSPPGPAGSSAKPDRAASARPAFDPCADSTPPARPYEGILRAARCEQEMFLTMASVSGQLGVPCGHCHAPKASDTKTFEYEEPTAKKDIANWMHDHLMRSIKPKDGSPMKCSSCHTGDDGKPLLKILGEPRDPVRAQEFMAMVMVNRFVTQSGDKLRCKSCHGGNLGSSSWRPKVILQSDALPPP